MHKRTCLRSPNVLAITNTGEVRMTAGRARSSGCRLPRSWTTLKGFCHEHAGKRQAGSRPAPGGERVRRSDCIGPPCTRVGSRTTIVSGVKNRTRRRLGAWTRTPLAVSSGVLTVVGFIATVVFAIFGGNARSWAWAAFVATLLAIGTVRLAIVRDVAGDPTFFLPLNFDDLTARQRDEMV